MEINKENYEAFLLDLWENNLSEEKKVMLYKFLDKHPELNENDAFSLISDISNTNSNAVFDKSSIDFEQINSKNYEFFFIAYSEGDLSKDEMKSVDDFLNEYPELNNKFLQFNKVRFPLETIEYPCKERLILGKTRVISIQSKRWFIGIAAAGVAFLLWISVPVQETPYLYTMSPIQELEIERFIDDSYEINTENVISQKNNSDIKNELAEQPIHSKADYKQKERIEKVENRIALNIKKEKQQDFKSPSFQKIPKLINREQLPVSQLDKNETPEVIASIVSVNKSVDQKSIITLEQVKDKKTTIVDLTASYLQRKNVLDEERKPDFKRIINNTLSNVNENKKPIILIEEEDNSKTTIFQFAGMKVERRKRK